MSCDQFWRTRLRALFAGRLIGNTAAGPRVYEERNLPWNIWEPDDTAEYPAIAIYTGSGRFQSSRGNSWTGPADITVEAWVTGTDAASILAALESLQDAIYGLILGTEMDRFTVTDITDDEPAVVAAAVTVGCARMTFTVEFGLCFSAPAGITPFVQANFQTDLKNASFDLAVQLEQPPEP